MKRLWSSSPRSCTTIAGDLTALSTYQDAHAQLVELERGLPPSKPIGFLTSPCRRACSEASVLALSASGLAPRTVGPQCARGVVCHREALRQSLETARELNTLVLELWPSISCIASSLSRERPSRTPRAAFANSIFEPLWNRQTSRACRSPRRRPLRRTRGNYYEEAGVNPGHVPNHLLQLLTLTAMEPPVEMSADAVRDEKVKVLRSVRWLTPEMIPDDAVRAQYVAGRMDGSTVPGFLQEEHVNPESMTPTFAALRLHVDNWRWKGVPFYCARERMPKRVSEIAIQFRAPRCCVRPRRACANGRECPGACACSRTRASRCASR